LQKRQSFQVIWLGAKTRSRERLFSFCLLLITNNTVAVFSAGFEFILIRNRNHHKPNTLLKRVKSIHRTSLDEKRRSDKARERQKPEFSCSDDANKKHVRVVRKAGKGGSNKEQDGGTKSINNVSISQDEECRGRASAVVKQADKG